MRSFKVITIDKNYCSLVSNYHVKYTKTVSLVMPLRFTRREEDVIEVISNLITTLTHSVLDFFVFVRRPYNLNFLRHQNGFATNAPHRFKQFRLSRNFRVKCVRASFFFVSIKICVYINNY